MKPVHMLILTLDDKVRGVGNAEVAYMLYGRISKWFLFVGREQLPPPFRPFPLTTGTFPTPTFENRPLTTIVSELPDLSSVYHAPLFSSTTLVAARKGFLMLLPGHSCTLSRVRSSPTCIR